MLHLFVFLKLCVQNSPQSETMLYVARKTKQPTKRILKVRTELQISANWRTKPDVPHIGTLGIYLLVLNVLLKFNVHVYLGHENSSLPTDI